MTVVVGYLAGKSGTAALHLAVGAARTLRTSLTVVTIVPKPWTTPSPARIDAEYASWADQLAADSAKEAQRYLSDRSRRRARSTTTATPTGRCPADWSRWSTSSVPTCWCSGRRRTASSVRSCVGSTADRLLHSSPVPLAIAPRGYRGARTGSADPHHLRLPRHPGVGRVVERIADLAKRLDVPLRVITLRGPRPHHVSAGNRSARRGFDPGGLGDQCPRDVGAAAHDGVVGDDVALQVVSGNGWDQALDAAEWQDGDVLALGTSPRGAGSKVCS